MARGENSESEQEWKEKDWKTWKRERMGAETEFCRHYGWRDERDAKNTVSLE